MLAAVARMARTVDVPVTADMEGGYGLPAAELAERLAATGAVGLNLEDTDHARHPDLVPIAQHADRIAGVKAAADLVLNARIDVHLRGGTTAEALERARAYHAAGADCVYPIGDRRRRDDRRVRRDRDPRERPAAAGRAADRPAGGARRRPDQPRPLPARRDARRAASASQPPRYAFVIGIRRSRPNARGVILIPGGAWRRLYSARSTSAKTRSTASSGSPASASWSRPASSST